MRNRQAEREDGIKVSERIRKKGEAQTRRRERRSGKSRQTDKT
jgi:hypothetical protein